ncbi:MAG: amidohydrolase family protein, partial [Gammaproteobacteria bacterium]
MWKKKTAQDEERGNNSPVPTQIVSNEEFPPLPQTPDQKAVEHSVKELADKYAAKLGTSRREFLKTTGGMATGFLAMNAIHGCSFAVSEDEALDSDAYAEGMPRDEFIFDAQTHHVKDSIKGPMVFRTMTARAGLNPALEGINPGPDTLHRGNFVKEVFFDSDTDMAIMTGAVIGPPKHHALPVEDIVETRNIVNKASGS